MRQSVFVKLNQDKWSDYEQKINEASTVPADELARIYVHLTEDLAYCKAKYSNTKLHMYLNNLTVKLHNIIYSNKPVEKSRFYRFWIDEVPPLYKQSYRQILYAAMIFIVGILIGVISAANDETFIRLILGDGYVDMTLKNIREGNPMAVYSSSSESRMFLFITTNNIKVSFFAFAAGLLFSLGTGYILISNGIMLGAFHYLFFENNVFAEHIVSIWIHGTLEISAIVIAGAAGLVMGNGLLFPGTYPRLYSFRKSAIRGVKIVVSLIPFFIIAGFLESFVTRHTEWSFVLKLLIVGISALVVLFYFLVLPNLNKLYNEQHKAL